MKVKKKQYVNKLFFIFKYEFKPNISASENIPMAELNLGGEGAYTSLAFKL